MFRFYARFPHTDTEGIDFMGGNFGDDISPIQRADPFDLKFTDLGGFICDINTHTCEFAFVIFSNTGVPIDIAAAEGAGAGDAFEGGFGVG